MNEAIKERVNRWLSTLGERPDEMVETPAARGAGGRRRTGDCCVMARALERELPGTFAVVSSHGLLVGDLISNEATWVHLSENPNMEN